MPGEFDVYSQAEVEYGTPLLMSTIIFMRELRGDEIKKDK